MLGWVIVTGLLVAGAAAAAIVGIINASGRRVEEEKAKQASSANFLAGIANQGNMAQVVADGLVEISGTAFPNGGGTWRARADTRPQGPVIQAVAQAAAVVVTPPGAAQVFVLPAQPAAAQPLSPAQPGQAATAVQPPPAGGVPAGGPPAPPEPPAGVP